MCEVFNCHCPLWCESMLLASLQVVRQHRPLVAARLLHLSP